MQCLTNLDRVKTAFDGIFAGTMVTKFGFRIYADLVFEGLMGILIDIYRDMSVKKMILVHAVDKVNDNKNIYQTLNFVVI